MGEVRGMLRGGGVYVYRWLIHAVVQQKLTQHCQIIILQLKKKQERNSIRGVMEGSFYLEMKVLKMVSSIGS